MNAATRGIQRLEAPGVFSPITEYSHVWNPELGRDQNPFPLEYIQEPIAGRDMTYINVMSKPMLPLIDSASKRSTRPRATREPPRNPLSTKRREVALLSIRATLHARGHG